MERRDYYGRTEEQIVAAIAEQEGTYAIATAWGGNEGLALRLAQRRANIQVDRDLLARLRGQKPDEIRLLSPEARKKMHATLSSFERRKTL